MEAAINSTKNKKVTFENDEFICFSIYHKELVVFKTRDNTYMIISKYDTYVSESDYTKIQSDVIDLIGDCEYLIENDLMNLEGL